MLSEQSIVMLVEQGRLILETEAAALQVVARRLDRNFSDACELLLQCQGRIVVMGMGKSGHIGGKIASTLASTGTPAFFIHPGEASHGDIGMITPKDLILALSNSGETPEILTILPVVKRMGVKLIALTGHLDSTLSRLADIHLDVAVDKEACPLNLAPTSSTTVALAVGDALAVTLLGMRGFTRQDFARSHPGGVLGRRLLLYVNDIMHAGNEIPLVQSHEGLSEALLEMTSKGLGMTGVIKEGQLVGIFTDGDLRRGLHQNVDIYTCTVEDLMTANPITTRSDILAAELVQLMRTHSINGLFVLDDQLQVTGAVNMHDLIQAGVV